MDSMSYMFQEVEENYPDPENVEVVYNPHLIGEGSEEDDEAYVILEEDRAMVEILVEFSIMHGKGMHVQDYNTLYTSE